MACGHPLLRYLQKYVLASYYFKNFTNTFPNSQDREEADFMTAYANFQMSPSFRLDQTYTDKAIDGFQLFVNTYPTSSRVEECNRLIDEMREKEEKKAFAEAELYFNLKQYQSATHTFENLLQDFPDTKQAEEVRWMITRAAYLLAENSVYDKQEERFQEALKNPEKFLKKHPRSKFAKEVKSIRDDSDDQLKNLKNDGYQNKSARS